MYINLVVRAYTIKESTNYYTDVANNQKPFSILCIDRDSYIVGAKLETSLNFHVTDGVHNLQIGKYSSLAEDILFLMDVDKDYKQVCMGAVSVFQGHDFKWKINRKRKGQVIIQNDCWVANGVTIMGGVTIHNGAIIAAASVVTQDVPPYAIVGGNPARVIKYRFDEQQIQHLQRIAWWDWSQEKIKKNAELFHRDVSEFISDHIADANRELSNGPQLVSSKISGVQPTYLFIPDFYEPYPIYEKVMDEFARYFDGKNVAMLVYIKQDDQMDENKSKICNILDRYSDCNYFINIYTEKVEDERSLFKIADYYITTRTKENVQRMCFADLYNTECISGVDIPVFGSEEKKNQAIITANRKNNMTSNRFELIIYIPTFNRNEKLKNCLDIISKEIMGLEDKVLVYVSNNGSSDGTGEYLESLDYKWLHIRHNKENVGAALNILHCFDLPIKSEFVWPVGDDDYLMPNAISGLLSLIKEYPEADNIFCNTKAFSTQYSDEILRTYFQTGSVEGGRVKSKYTGTSLVDFEQLINPDIADTLLGELMVHCFRQSSIQFDTKEIKEIMGLNSATADWDNMDFEAAGKLIHVHTLPFLSCFNKSTKAIYCDVPRTFNFWGSAEWMGDYDYFFPIGILFLISQYKEHGFISDEKFINLLDYYYSIMRGPLFRQISGQSTARPFNSIIKAKMFEFLFQYMIKLSEKSSVITQKASASNLITTKLNPDVPLTSIITLTHNQLEYTKKCIESIFKHTKEPFELIVVDNGSSDGTVEYLETEIGGQRTEDGGRRSEVRSQKSEVGGRGAGGRGQRVEVRIIRNKENLGFAAGNNQGMAAARGDYILLMNNDIVVTPGWLTNLIACAEQDRKIGIVGPVSNYVSGPQLVKDVTYNTENLDGLNEFASEFSNKHSGKDAPFWRVVGFCMLIKRAVIDKIGGLDARYGLGNFEDDDFSLRARLAGYESRIAEDCFVHHYGNRTFLAAQIDYKKSLHKNWEIFKEKWGIPKNVPYGSSYDLSFLVKDGFIHSKHYFSIGETPDLQISKEKKTIFSSSIQEEYLEIQQMLTTGKKQEAKEALEKLLLDDPEFVLAHNDLGVLYFLAGDKAKALKHYERAVALQPVNVTFQKNLADFYCIEMGRIEEAVQIYVNILNDNPADVETLLALGHICRSLEREDDAADFFMRVLGVDPGNEDARQSLISLRHQETGGSRQNPAEESNRRIVQNMNGDRPEDSIERLKQLLMSIASGLKSGQSN